LSQKQEKEQTQRLLFLFVKKTFVKEWRKDYFSLQQQPLPQSLELDLLFSELVV
jgi:hypothetical protein